MRHMTSGAVVALTACPAEVLDDGSWEPVQLSGLFTLEDYQPYEPSMYAWRSGWYVVPANEDAHGDRAIDVSRSDGLSLFVEDTELMQQVNPAGYGRMLVHEREHEALLEREHERMT